MMMSSRMLTIYSCNRMTETTLIRIKRVTGPMTASKENTNANDPTVASRGHGNTNGIGIWVKRERWADIVKAIIAPIVTPEILPVKTTVKASYT